MRINRLNYEESLIDYLDGNLDPVLTAELLAFLSDNPDLENQCRDLKSINCQKVEEDLCYPDKDALKKDFTDIETINEDNFDEFCIAGLEGLLKDEGKNKLLCYITLHPEKAADYKLFSHTVLRSDNRIHFPGKEALERDIIIRPYSRFLYSVMRIAAVAAVLILVIITNPGEKTGTVEFTDAFVIRETIKNEKNSGTEFILRDIASNPVNKRIKTAGIVENKQVPLSTGNETLTVPRKKASIAATILPNPYLAPPSIVYSKNRQALIPPYSQADLAGVKDKTVTHNIPDLSGMLGKVNGWKTAEKIVKGFNYLTESAVSLTSTFDDKGNLTNLRISSEAFIIATHRNN